MAYMQYIDSGTWAVKRRSPGRLIAVLGTCVGVAIRDRVAGIGGLVHLLLPEPTACTPVDAPGKYASTGIDCLLEELCALGGHRADFEAFVAGGALVGPVSEIDLSLDIGGRTTLIAEKKLRDAGIRIVASETGGYFTCNLLLNMASLDITIEPPIHPTPGSADAAPATVRPDPGEIDETIRRIRPIPQVALRVARMIYDDSYHLSDLATEIRQDQVIAGKVLRLCNSASIGTPARINSIEEALVLLGEKRLLQMVVNASAELLFSQAGQGYSLCKGGLFQHALTAARLTGKLAAFTGKVKEDVAYTAGLLHDIGKVALDQHLADRLPYFYRRMNVEHRPLLETEQEYLGISHTEVGGRLARMWSFPEELIAAIEHHHRPDDAEGLVGDLVHLVYLSDLLMSRFHGGLELDRLRADYLGRILDRLDLSVQQFANIVDLIPRSEDSEERQRGKKT